MYILITGDKKIISSTELTLPVNYVYIVVSNHTIKVTYNNLKISFVQSYHLDYISYVKLTSQYVDNLNHDERKVFNQICGKTSLTDFFLSGLACWYAFVKLLEHGLFCHQLPFQFRSLTSGITQNELHLLDVPLTAYLKLTSGVLKLWMIQVQIFINVWSPIFPLGNKTDKLNNQICLDVIHGYSMCLLTDRCRLEEEIVKLQIGFKKLEQEMAMMKECKNTVVSRCDSSLPSNSDLRAVLNQMLKERETDRESKVLMESPKSSPRQNSPRLDIRATDVMFFKERDVGSFSSNFSEMISEVSMKASVSEPVIRKPKFQLKLK